MKGASDDLQAFDSTTMRDATAGPGQDTRQWVSYGIVNLDTPSTRSVRFNDEDGNPLPPGPLVDVTLEPSGVVVPCRVGSQCAGSGESEWHPIGPGDEVLVAIPEGDERAGCVIICRLNQAGKDSMPGLVAGSDPTQNNFAFKRVKAAYLIESGTSLLLRNALTLQQLVFPQDGSVLLNSGDGHLLALNHTVLSLQKNDGSVSLQIDTSLDHLSLVAKGTSLVMSDLQSQFFTGGTLAIATSGINAFGHAITFEQVVNLFVNFIYFLNSAGDPSTWTMAGKILFPASFPATLTTALTEWLTLPTGAANVVVPPTPVTGGGNLIALGVPGIIEAAILLQTGTDPGALTGVPIPGMYGVTKPGLLF